MERGRRRGDEVGSAVERHGREAEIEEGGEDDALGRGQVSVREILTQSWIAVYCFEL